MIGCLLLPLSLLLLPAAVCLLPVYYCLHDFCGRRKEATALLMVSGMLTVSAAGYAAVGVLALLPRLFCAAAAACGRRCCYCCRSCCRRSSHITRASVPKFIGWTCALQARLLGRQVIATMALLFHPQEVTSPDIHC